MTRDLLGAQWHKSSYSGDDGNCVEIASNLPGVVGVRDSKDRARGHLTLSRDAFDAFLAMIKG